MIARPARADAARSKATAPTPRKAMFESTLLAAVAALATVLQDPVPATPVAPKPAAPAAPASAPGTAKARQEKGPKAPVYDVKADGKADVARAVAAAKKHERRVLVQWGANWCGWCKLLHATSSSDGALAKELLYEYEVVRVDVGQFDKNLDLAESLGAGPEALKKAGIPYLTILDADGKPLANEETSQFELADKSKPAYDTEKLVAFLKKHEAKTTAAADLLAAGLAKAKETGKVLFLDFSAPWCGFCKMLERWSARPDVAPILEKEFVVVTVDTDRSAFGKAMLDRYSNGKSGGIPWFVFLSPEGKALADSNGPQGNVGFPLEPHEIEHFASMLKKVQRALTDEDIAKLRATLVEEDAKRRAPR